MKKRTLVSLALAIGCLAQLALASPDLAVTHMEVTPSEPTDGLLVTISATIENVGPTDTDGAFFVRFVVDGHEIDVVPLTSLDAGRDVEVQSTWTATAGPHVLAVEADAPHERIDEPDEENNIRAEPLTVRLGEEAMAVLAPLKIAVARFDDDSGAGFVNVGNGVAEELAGRFASTGLRVIDHAELDATLQANGLNPAFREDVARAGRLVGADLLVVGTVLDIHVQETSLTLGFLRVDNAAVDVRLGAEVIDARTSEPLASVSAEGFNEGTTGFSIDLGALLSFLTAGSSEVCTGGLQADRAWYNSSQTVLLGYRNDAAPAWFGVEIYSSTGSFLQWLGWQFVATDDCGTWSWDQRDAFGAPMSPGIYAAKLWDGTSHIDTVGFQIRPGISVSVPAADEITVGTPQFSETVVGSSMNQAIDRLTSTLLLAMADTARFAFAESSDEAPLAAAAMEGVAFASRQGQIAAVLPDGRIAINLGASSGVTVGDRFEVLEVESLVVDPNTSEILGYELLAVKGVIEVIEARERVSYAIRTADFPPIIGDVVRDVP